MPTTLVDTVTGHATTDGGFLLVSATLHFGDGTTESLSNRAYTADQYQAARVYLSVEVKPSQYAQASDPTPPATPQADDRDVADFIAMIERWNRLPAHPAPPVVPATVAAPAITV